MSLLAPPKDIDLLEYARGVVELERKPVLSFDCGTEDELLEENRWLHSELDKLGLEHKYAEFDGGHEWDYWDLHVRDALEQHAKVLGL